MADPEVVVEMIGTSLAHRILAKYAGSLASAGSQLGQVGIGYASTPALGAVGTVAMKLARSPIVERVLWLESAADVARRIDGRPKARKEQEDLTCERAEIVDCLFEFDFNSKNLDRRAAQLTKTQCYQEQWCLLVVELSAAMGDQAFRDWAMP